METVASLTTLGESQQLQTCSVLAVDGRMMQVKAPKPVGVGSAVKVEADDTLSLGEVSYCRPERDGYMVWVELTEALHNVQELSRLARALIS
jgi:hypothetical protein